MSFEFTQEEGRSSSKRRMRKASKRIPSALPSRPQQERRTRGGPVTTPGNNDITAAELAKIAQMEREDNNTQWQRSGDNDNGDVSDQNLIDSFRISNSANKNATNDTRFVKY